MSAALSDAAPFRRPPARQFSEPIAARRLSKRKANRAPVHRWSVEKGKEGDLWRPMRRDLRPLMREFYDALQTWGRTTDSNWGVLTGKGRRVLAALMERVNWNTGQLDPSWDDLQGLADCCRQTLRRSLDAFETLGLLRRQRRCDRSRAGWRQTSNAYALLFPPELVREFGRRFADLLDVYRTEEGPGCDAWAASRREPRCELDLVPLRTAQERRLAKVEERKRVSAQEAQYGWAKLPPAGQLASSVALPSPAEPAARKAAMRAQMEASADWRAPESSS